MSIPVGIDRLLSVFEGPSNYQGLCVNLAFDLFPAHSLILMDFKRLFSLQRSTFRVGRVRRVTLAGQYCQFFPFPRFFRVFIADECLSVEGI